MVKKLFIVTGASGELGRDFVRKLSEMGEKVMAFSRKSQHIEGAEVYRADLLSEQEVFSTVSEINLSNYDEVYLIHAVGKFKFEESASSVQDLDKDGIDDEIYATNVLTLKNILKALLALCNPSTKVNVCAFASVSDKHNVPFWNSYTQSKNITREYLKELCESPQIRALVVSVSTIDTGNENLLRPQADKTYWLQPHEIVSKALPELMSLSTFKEIEVIKEKPGFDTAYYFDHEAILKKWKEEMGQGG